MAKNTPMINMPSVAVNPIEEAKKMPEMGFDGMIRAVIENKDPEKVRTSIYIKKEYKDKRDIAANNEAVSQSIIMMAALDDFFEKHPEMIKEKPKDTEKWNKFK